MFWRKLFSVWWLPRATGSEKLFLVGRAGLTTLDTSNSSGLSYNGLFSRSACQGCKALAGIKLLVHSAQEDKFLSISLINCIMKAVKD